MGMVIGVEGRFIHEWDPRPRRQRRSWQPQRPPPGERPSLSPGERERGVRADTPAHPNRGLGSDPPHRAAGEKNADLKALMPIFLANVACSFGQGRYFVSTVSLESRTCHAHETQKSSPRPRPSH